MSSKRDDADQPIRNIFNDGEYFTKIEGVTIPRKFFDFQHDIEHFEIFDDDIWVCTFPKSGTTWMQEIVWMIVNDLDFEGAKRLLNDRFPFFEDAEKYKDFPMPESYVDSLNYLKKLKRPRTIKTHLPLHLLPKQIQNGTKRPKMIYVARNEKDVCVSFYYHYVLIEGYTGSMDEFTDLFLNDKLYYAPYWNHVLSFWERRDQENFMFLKYEDMKHDLIPILHKIAHFVGKTITDHQAEILSQHVSVDSMRQNNAVNLEPLMEFYRNHGHSKGKGHFIRLGKVGDHKDKLTPECIERFNKWKKNNVGELEF